MTPHCKHCGALWEKRSDRVEGLPVTGYTCVTPSCPLRGNPTSMKWPAGATRDALSIFVVTRKPLDYPAHYVVRRWEVRAGTYSATDDFAFEPTLRAVRKHIPRGLARLPKQAEDDFPIVETWI